MFLNETVKMTAVEVLESRVAALRADATDLIEQAAQLDEKSRNLVNLAERYQVAAEQIEHDCKKLSG